jgi:hypothetical protein
MVWLAQQYNNAFLIPEGRFPGNATCARIISLGYYNIYQRKNPDKVGEQGEQDAFLPGFMTSAGKKGNAKALIVELAVRLFRDNKILLRTPNAIREWKIFQQLDGGYSAPDGDNDDCVMCDLFAVFAQFTPGVAPIMVVAAKPVEEQPDHLNDQASMDKAWHENRKKKRDEYNAKNEITLQAQIERQERAMNGRYKRPRSPLD